MNPSDGLPQAFAYQRDESVPGNVSIIGVDVTLTPDLMPVGKNLFVYADTLSIPAPVSLPGMNVSILARRIVAPSGSYLSVSGGPPAPAIVSRAQDGATSAAADGLNGADGTDGAPGANGQDGGTILIHAGTIEGVLALYSNGGQGQTGQDGGNGGDGHQGLPGADGQTTFDPRVSHSPVQGQPGTVGGTGGGGGNAGKSGDGGTAGTVYIWTLTEVIGTSAFVTIQPGSPGGANNAGRGGNGGPGGVGGFLNRVSSASFGADRIIYELSDQRAATGPTGSNGPMGNIPSGTANPNKPSVPQAGVGSPGKTGAAVIGFSYLQFTNDPNVLIQRTLTLHQAELSFLNRDWAYAQTLLTWLRDLTPAAGSAGVPAANGAEWTHLHERVVTLLSYLEKGLDYFGEARNHVPLLSLNFYRKETPVLLDIGKMIESAYSSYLADTSQQADRLTALNQTIAQTDRHLTALQSDLADTRAEQNRTQDVIETLHKSQMTQQGVVQSAQDAYRAAVLHAGDGCSFLDLIKGVVNVLTMAQQAYNDVTNIAAAAKSIGSGDGGIIGTIKTIYSARGDATDLRDKFNAVAGLNSDSRPDQAKLLMPASDLAARIRKFDASIDQVISSSSDSGVVDAARNYKKQVHIYVDLVQARNRKVYDYTALVLRDRRLRAIIDQKTAELSRVKNAAAGAIDPTLPALRTFMAGAYHDVRADLIRYILHGRAAYNYATLQQTQVSLSTQNIAGLAQSHATLLSDIETFFNSAPTREIFQGSAVAFDAHDYGPQFAEFRAGKVNGQGHRLHYFGFSIPFSQFPNWYQVVAHGFTVSIPHATTTGGPLDVDLVHSGHARFLDASLNVVDYTHRPTLQDYSSGGGVTSGGQLGGGDASPETIGVSPCTAWTLVVSENANPGLDLSAVTQFTLTFSGKYYPRPLQATA